MADFDQTTPLSIPVKRLPHGHCLPLPAHQTAEAACTDLYAAIDAPLILQPGARATIPTGLAYALPPGYCAQVWPRSGLAVKQGLDILAGMIDSDYRGEYLVAVINHGQAPITVSRGDRIAQLLIVPYVRVALHEVEALPETERGTSGFGSTGT